jgi:hypothetical protein
MSERIKQKYASRFGGLKRSGRKWQAGIPVNGKLRHLGTFGFEVDAAICWNAHAAHLRPDHPLNEIPIDEYAHD